jgi:hypothetical protein
MTLKFRCHVILVLAALLPATAAQAQWYSSVDRKPPPLYPYAAQPQRPYAVEVAPNTYVIHRPRSGARHAPRHHARRVAQAAAPVANKRHAKAEAALIEDLRQRASKNDARANKPPEKKPVISSTRIEQEKPIVHETTRYVDDPPRVVERRRYADGGPVRSRGKRVGAEPSAGAQVINRNEKRTFSAEAEITVLGPDRMSIRLFRKGVPASSKAEALPGED